MKHTAVRRHEAKQSKCSNQVRRNRKYRLVSPTPVGNPPRRENIQQIKGMTEGTTDGRCALEHTVGNDEHSVETDNESRSVWRRDKYPRPGARRQIIVG